MRRSASSTCVVLLGELALVREPLPGGAGARLAVVQAAVRRSGPRRVRSSSTASRLGVVALRLRRPGRGPGRPAARRRRTRRSRSARATPRPPCASASTSSRADSSPLSRVAAAVSARASPPWAYRCRPLGARPRRLPRGGAERSASELDREYYLHDAGHKAELEIEPIYERHGWPVRADAVDGSALRRAAGRRHRRRARGACATCWPVRARGLPRARRPAPRRRSSPGSRRRSRSSLRRGRSRTARCAVEQANEPDPERRAALEAARNELLAERLNPLYRAALERAHELCRELGLAELRRRLRRAPRHRPRRRSPARRSVPARRPTMPTRRSSTPQLERAGLPPLGELAPLATCRVSSAPPTSTRRSRASGWSPRSRRRWRASGIELRAQRNVHLDTEPRPTKSPARLLRDAAVPGEVYLVIAPVGGRDDYGALFHEGGHTEHYAQHRRRPRVRVPSPRRQLGHRVVRVPARAPDCEDPVWLAAASASTDPGEAAPTRGRRSSCSCAATRPRSPTSSSSTARDPRSRRMPARYAALLGEATRVPLAARELARRCRPRLLRRLLPAGVGARDDWRPGAPRSASAKRWFESAEAGEWLRGLWRNGQRLGADGAARRGARGGARLRGAGGGVRRRDVGLPGPSSREGGSTGWSQAEARAAGGGIERSPQRRARRPSQGGRERQRRRAERIDSAIEQIREASSSRSRALRSGGRAARPARERSRLGPERDHRPARRAPEGDRQAPPAAHRRGRRLRRSGGSGGVRRRLLRRQRPPSSALLQPLVDLGEHALARLAVLLLGAHLTQLGLREVAEPRLDLCRGQLVVGRDR